jgi:glycosyltransferase involved in cell wall biosynthesis
MKIHWATHFKVVAGNGYGYTLSNVYMRKALSDIGVEQADDAKISVHLCHPVDFKPVYGKKNILFTMYESSPVPEIFREYFLKADGILVPTNFVFDLFRQYKPKSKNMFVSRLGFDDDLYSYVERSWQPFEPFHFLWIGAPNARKGWPYAMSAFAHLFGDQPWAFLTMKTSSETGDGRVVFRDNITFDSRRYDDPSMLFELYSKAHCFLAPSLGEGFGLTPLEAMSTGLPVIATWYGGLLDFCKTENSWLVPYQMERVDQTDGSPYNAAIPDVPAICAAMKDIVADYPAALRKAKIGSDMVRQEFTWKAAAKELVSNIKKFGFDE